MDKIYRKISLEQGKNRTPNALPYYMINNEEHTCVLQDNGNAWNGYCVDILAPKTANRCFPIYNWVYDLEDIYHFEEVEVPVGDVIVNNGTTTECICKPENVAVAFLLRYKNLMNMYHWLKNVFFESIMYYTRCENDFKQLTVSDRNKIFYTDIELFNNLIEAVNVPVGTIVGVTNLYNEFINRFKTRETATEFLTFMERLLKEGLFEYLSGTTPYFDFEFSLTTTDVDLGVMSAAITDWVPKKKYYLGDYVLYNNQLYQLRFCDNSKYDKFLLTGQLLIDMLTNVEQGDGLYVLVNNERDIPRETFSLNKPKISAQTGEKIDYTYCILQETVSGLSNYYLIQPYYNGCVVYGVNAFDDGKPSMHWYITSKNGGIKQYFTYNTENNTYTYESMGEEVPELTGITESKLIALKRKVTSVDDFGEVLPFIIDSSGSTNTELFYSIGIVNETEDDGGEWRGDELVQIRYRERNGEYSSATTIVNTGETFDDRLINVTCDDFIYDSGVIEFTYYIGCQIKMYVTFFDWLKVLVKQRIPYTGVKYTEEWYFNKLEKTVRIDNEDKTFRYINLYPIDTIDYSANNVDINGKKPIYSIITYYGKEIANADLLYTQYYKEEDLLGVQDVNMTEYDPQTRKYVKAIDCYIDRGIAASYERHNILNEVKTFSDLVNYRNNFFEL